MKHKGSIFEYEDARCKELLLQYNTLARETRLRGKALCQRLVYLPTSRFWVSEERAYYVVKAMMEHKPLSDMLPLKRLMYQHIYERVLSLMNERPSARLYDLVFEAVNSPAPRHYCTPDSLQVIIHRIKKRWKHNPAKPCVTRHLSLA